MLDDNKAERAARGGMVDALECVIDDRPSAVPLERAGQVIEYEVAPLPLAVRGVRGLGVHQERILLSLGSPIHAVSPRRALAVLVEGTTGWPGLERDEGAAIEVDRVIGFVRVRRDPRDEEHVATPEGRRLRWVSPESLLRGDGGGR